MGAGGSQSTDLPPLYERWLREATPCLPPPETTATCDNCVMCSPSRSGEVPPDCFHPDVKCCSYHPVLPSFSVGLALAHAPTRALLRQRLEARLGVSPLGVGPGRFHDLLYQHGKARGFGRSRSLLCPYFSAGGDGSCGVWPFRNAICASYYCKHDRGRTGHELWLAVRDFLVEVERDLAWHCALELGLDPQALRALTSHPVPEPPLTAADLDRLVDERSYEAQWGSWRGREEEFFLQCGEVVAAMSWSAIARVCGPSVEAHRRVLGNLLDRAVTPSIPERIAVAELLVRPAGPDAVRVSPHSRSAPIEMPRQLFSALRHFDGAETAKALAAIRDEEGLELEDDLVLRLLDHRILVPGNAD